MIRIDDSPVKMYLIQRSLFYKSFKFWANLAGFCSKMAEMHKQEISHNTKKMLLGSRKDIERVEMTSEIIYVHNRADFNRIMYERMGILSRVSFYPYILTLTNNPHKPVGILVDLSALRSSELNNR